MTKTEHWYRGRFQELTEAECWELVATKTLGRVAYCDPQGPVVLPVNHVAHEGAVIFRTSPHSLLALQGRGMPAAFQVDDADDYTESGWSVLMRGTMSIVESVEDLPDTALPEPWPEGVRSLYLRVAPHSVTGRRVLAT